jgi:tetratricopeptide (TPR) repeat protein
MSEMASALVAKGRGALSEGTHESLERAVALFERAVAVEPKFEPGYVGLAIACVELAAEPPLRQRWLERAIEAGEKAVELDPLGAEAYVALGRAYRSKGLLRKEEQLWRRRLEIDPQDAIARTRGGWVLWFTGRPAEGLEWLSAAAGLRPADQWVQRWVYFFMGNANLAMGNHAEAERSYRKQLELHPDHSSAEAGLIWSLLAAGIEDEARSEKARFAEGAYDGDRCALKLADIEYVLGQDDQASQHAREALSEPDERYWPRGFLASTILGALLWHSDRAAATTHFASSERIDRERLAGGDEGYMAHVDLAAVQAVRGDIATACRSLRSAVTAGWRYAALAARDRLFETLRADPAFISLVSGNGNVEMVGGDH